MSEVPTAPVLIHIIIVFLRILDVVVRHDYEAFLQAVDHALMRLADRPVARRDVVGLLLLAKGLLAESPQPCMKEKDTDGGNKKTRLLRPPPGNHINQTHSNQASARS